MITFSPEQQEWIARFESETDFDVMWQEDYLQGDITFYELVYRNLRWLEDFHLEQYQAVEVFNWSCEDILNA